MRNNPSYITSETRVSSTLPVSLTDLKAHLPVFGTQDDTRLTALQWNAVEFIEKMTNRYLTPTNVTEVWSNFPTMYCGNLWWGLAGQLPFYPMMETPSGLPWHWGEVQRMELSRNPIISITSLSYYDTNNLLQTLVQGTDYWLVAPTVRPGFVQPSGVWPIAYYRPDSVQITYQAGFSTLPYKADILIKLLVGHLNENREGTSDKTISEIPFGIEALMQSLSTGGMI